MKEFLRGENLSRDYIADYELIPKRDEDGNQIVVSEDNSTYKLEKRVNNITFYDRLSRDRFKMITLERKTILWLASEINRLEDQVIPDGEPSYMDDDLPF